MTTVRAKMTCQSTKQFSGSVEVQLTAVYSQTGENKDFTDSTPSGSLTMSIIKGKLAATVFEPGKSYYVDFTEAPAA